MFSTARRCRRLMLPLVAVLLASLVAGGSTAGAASAPTNNAVPAPIAMATAATPTAATVTGVRRSMVIGYSRQHRPIIAYELGNPEAPFKTLVLGSIHGYYERAGEQVVGALRTSAIPKNLDLWVIATLNPDGDVLHQRGNAAGVDLNRNFPFRWTYIAPTASKFDSHYSGPSPLSEPESRAMYNFLGALRPARVVSLHQPLDAVDMTDGGARDIAFRDALARNLGLPESPLVCWGVCHGSMTGWLTNSQPGAAITVEFPQNPSSAYLTGTAARGILAALGVGVKPYVQKTVRGHVDAFTASPAGLLLAGWTYDPARPAESITLPVTVDGKVNRVATASGSRPDVDKAFRITGAHGFWMNLVLPKGRHTVCVTARAARGSDSLPTPLVTCRVVTVPQVVMQGRAAPLVLSRSGAVRTAGWTFDASHPGSPGRVRIEVDSKEVTTVTTTITRADANALWHTIGQHGFDVTVSLKPGHHLVSVIAVGPSTAVVSTTLVRQWLVVPAA